MSALLEHLDEIMVSLRPRSEFRPLPPASDREAWSAVRQKTAATAIGRAEKYVGFAWPVIYATDIMLAATGGDARAFASKYNYRRTALSALALAEALEGKGRFLGDIINLCVMICEETAWTLPENLTRPDGTRDCMADIERPTLDIGAARTGALLATALYLHRDKFREASPLISVRVEREITLRVIDPFLNAAQLNYVRGGEAMAAEGIKECLVALLLTEREDRYRWGGVKRAMKLLDACLDALPGDGGIPGGMGAFEAVAGCLMEALALINEASGGNTSFFTISALRCMGEYIVGNHIDLDYFNCPGDCPAHLRLDAGLAYRCGELICSDELCSLGAYLLSLSDESVSAAATLLRGARTALGESAMLRHDARPPMPMDYYLRSEALLCARERTGSSSGFFVSLCGGANLPGSHADSGNMALYCDGEPVLPDLGEIEYARALNPDERAALWETQSQYHNLPVINNQPQSMGAQFQAIEPIWELAPERSRATLDISRAYPDEAGVLTWQRTVALMRNECPCVRLWEIAEFKGDSNDIEYNFITTHRPYLGRNSVELGNVVMSWETEGKLECDVQELPPRQSSAYDPEGLYGKWLLTLCGRTLFRMVLTQRAAPRRFDVCFTFTRKSNA